EPDPAPAARARDHTPPARAAAWGGRRLPRKSPWRRGAPPARRPWRPQRGRPSELRPAFDHLPREAHDPLRLESEFALQFLERSGGAEGFHPDNFAGRADIAFPTEHRALLDGDPRGHLRRQYAIAVGL